MQVPDNEILQLSKAEMEYPESVFRSVFESFNLSDIREYLDLAVEKLVPPGPDKSEQEAIDNDNTRFFFEKMVKMAEAAYLLREV